jgi:hypothetical protein
MKCNIARTMFVIFCLATLFASIAAGQTVPLSGHWEGVFTQPKVVPSVQPPTWFIYICLPSNCLFAGQGV